MVQSFFIELIRTTLLIVDSFTLQLLILLYSDTNYVLDGFIAEFSVTNCPSNCSSHGKCVQHRCVCNGEWVGSDCSQIACPDNCNARQRQGICSKDHCQCAPGFSGQACSLKKDNPLGNEYHWLADVYDGFYARAAHSAVYVEENDSLFVFGGYNLNRVLRSLQIYRFDKSRWEDAYGVKLRAPFYPGKIDSTLLRAVLYQDDSETWGLTKDRSFFKNILLSISENETSLRRTRSSNYTAEQEEELINKIIEHPRPTARYGHTSVAIKGGFVIFGGKQANGQLSNELWFYNISEPNGMRWSLRAEHSTLKPPPLARHTLTRVKDYLYLFGGSLANGDFSSR